MAQSHFYHISPGGNLIGVASPADAVHAANAGGFLWLDYRRPVQEELSVLVELLGLHPLAIEDYADDNQVPKIEDFPGNTFIIFHAFDYANGVLSIDEVNLFLGKNFLVTVSGRDSEPVSPLDGIEKISERDPENPRQGPAFLMHLVLDHLVDHKFVALEALEEELDKAEEAMLADLSSFKPADLLQMRRDLLTLRKSLFHEREILVKVCRKDSPYIPERAIFLFRDVYDHLAKSFELAESCRDLVTSLMEMYLSMINNQMALIANSTNTTVRRLTTITTIFMPLTLLAGIGGMSEWTMMTGPHNWQIAYLAFILLLVVVGIISYHLLKRLERRDKPSPQVGAGG